MDDQYPDIHRPFNQQSSDPNIKNDQTFSDDSKKVELKPSVAFVQDIQNSAPKEPETIQKIPANNNIYPDIGSTPLSTANKKINIKKKRIYSIVPSLQLYLIFLFVLGIFLFASLLRIHIVFIHKTTELRVLDTIRQITLTLPLISAIIIFISKSANLVKSLLAILSVNFLIGLIGYWYLAFRFHTLPTSAATLVGMTVEAIFLFWTWSIFSQVNELH